MSSEVQLVIEVWDVVREFVPENKREEVATSLVMAFSEFGFSSKEIMDIVDEDDDLAAAYESVFSDEDDEDENYYEEE